MDFEETREKLAELKDEDLVRFSRIVADELEKRQVQ